MEGFEYETSIKDGMSGPASDEVRALKSLQSQVAVTEKAIHGLQTEQLNYKRAGFKGAASDIALEISKARLHLGGLKTDLRGANVEHMAGLKAAKEAAKIESDAAKEAAKAARKAAIQAPDFNPRDGLLGAMLLKDGLEAVGSAAISAAEKMVSLTIESTKFAIEAAEFRDNTVLAYAAVQGTAEEGEATFKQLDRIAGQFHMPAKQAHQLARDLMLQGLEDTKLIGASIEATAALMRTGQVQGAQKLQTIIEKSLASGHFDGGKGLAGGEGGAASGRALAGLGVHLPELLADLAKRTGQSVGAVQAQLKAGKISTEVGVAALVDAINGGIIGKTAAAKYDIRDFTTDASNFFTRMVQEIDLKPLEKSLRDVSTVLGFFVNRKEGVQGVFQTIVDWSGKAIEWVTLLGLDAEIAFLRMQLEIQPIERAFDKVVDSIKEVIDWLDTAGQAMIEFSKHIPGLGTVVAGAQLQAPQNHQISWDEALLAPIGLGGIIEGARINTENSAHEMGINLGEQAVAGARVGADAHSPSDEMKDLGKDMSDGLGIGFSASSVTNSMRGGISDVGGSAGGHSFSFSMGDIHAPHASAHEVASLVASQVEDAWERFALELGR